MPRPSRPWFRLYVEAVSDQKLRRLTPSQRWLWIGVLAAARQSPIPGHLMVSEREAMGPAELADLAAMSVKEVQRTLPLFETAGMIEWDANLKAWAVTKWAERQFDSDKVSERSRKHRSNHPPQTKDGTFQRRSQERDNDVPSNDDATFPATMTDTESKTDLKPTPPAPPPTHAEPEPPRVGGDDFVNQAMTVLAERALTTSTGVTDPTAFVIGVRKRRSETHSATIAALDLAFFASPEALADHLEPPRKPAPIDRQSAANRANEARGELPPCPACDSTGWRNGTPADGKCDVCRRLMQRASA